MKNMIKVVITMMLLQMALVIAYAGNIVQLPDGTNFDATFYAASNADVVQSLGSDPNVLADHYWKHGIQEGRLPYAGASNVSASSVIALINDYRAGNGLKALETDATLTQAAQQRATELANSHHFGHTRPDGRAWESVVPKGICTLAGENLGRGTGDASGVVAAWKRSPDHNAAMLRSEWNKIGVGVAKSDDGKFYFAMIASNG